MVNPIFVYSIEKRYESSYHREISLHLKAPGDICSTKNHTCKPH